MSGARMKVIDILNGLKHEIRLFNKNQAMADNQMYKYISAQFQRNRVTSAQYCRDEDHASHLAQTYLCYLTSVRRHTELLDEYQNRPEATTEQAANIVGLKLPKTYTGDK